MDFPTVHNSITTRRNNLLCLTPSKLNLSLSSEIGLVPNQIYSSITFSVPFLAHALRMFWNFVKFEFSVMKGHSDKIEDSGLGA